MTLAKQPPLRDRRYLDSAREAACIVCGRQDGTVVMAHIRFGFFGLGIKPPDSHTLPLCDAHHRQQHQVGEASFWADVATEELLLTALLALARERYREWLRQ